MESTINNDIIVLDPGKDNIAVAKADIRSGAHISINDELIAIAKPIASGGRFAVKDIFSGEYVYQYGFPFGKSKGIKSGDLISNDNIEDEIPQSDIKNFQEPSQTEYDDTNLKKIFRGYRRGNGAVGTRNYYVVVPTSLCASETALQIALKMDNDPALRQQYPDLDGIVAIPHTEGCGCDSTLSIDRLLRILKGYILHPNVGGCLIIDLGCEQTNYQKVYGYLEDAVHKDMKPIDWLTIEENGGVAATKEKAFEIIRQQLGKVADIKRTLCPIENILVGTECGASDTFSGITANPLMGKVVDKIVSGKGSAILSEIPEMVGTFAMLLPRFRSVQVAEKFETIMKWYMDLALKLGLSLNDNLVLKNREGGLVNNYIKSLGAVMKGGSSVIEDVIEYGEPCVTRGLNIMQGPGGDLESVTGIVASGANIVLFSTGQGTPTGNAIAPVIKVASNSRVYQKLQDDVDFDAGKIFSANKNIDDLSDELFLEVLEVASGKKTACERLGQRQFQIWTAGKLPL